MAGVQEKDTGVISSQLSNSGKLSSAQLKVHTFNFSTSFEKYLQLKVHTFNFSTSFEKYLQLKVHTFNFSTSFEKYFQCTLHHSVPIVKE